MLKAKKISHRKAKLNKTFGGEASNKNKFSTFYRVLVEKVDTGKTREGDNRQKRAFRNWAAQAAEKNKPDAVPAKNIARKDEQNAR